MNKIPLIPVIILGRDPDNEALVCAVAELPEEPEVVGIMLADALRHVANAYTGAPGSSRQAAVALRIWEALKMEMANPTDMPTMITEHGRLDPGPVSITDDE